MWTTVGMFPWEGLSTDQWHSISQTNTFNRNAAFQAYLFLYLLENHEFLLVQKLKTSCEE